MKRAGGLEGPIWFQVDVNQPPPEVRVAVEEGAYLVVDFLSPRVGELSTWKYLIVGRLRLDLTPQGNPVLIELREPVEAWQVLSELNPPQPTLEGTATIADFSNRVRAPLIVKTNTHRKIVEIRLARAEHSVTARVGSRVLFETTGLKEVQGGGMQGPLLAIWILEVPALSQNLAILRALRLFGPPVAPT